MQKDCAKGRKKVCGFVRLISENGKKHINGSMAYEGD